MVPLTVLPGHYNYASRCLNHAPELRGRFLKKIHQFYTFTAKLRLYRIGGMPFKICCLLTLQVLNTKFSKNWLSSSSKENVNFNLTTDSDKTKVEFLSLHEGCL